MYSMGMARTRVIIPSPGAVCDHRPRVTYLLSCKMDSTQECEGISGDAEIGEMGYDEL